ncbi:unnamed protein product [Amaranthus hypochondriacus]
MAPNIPHVVCIPFPAQSHIKPMMNLANLLHSKGFYITLVLTEFDFARLLAASPDLNSPFLDSLHDFSFETIPDGLAADNARTIQDMPELFQSLTGEPSKAFRGLLKRLLVSPDVPPITSIISDGFMSFAYRIGEELGIRASLLFTVGACGYLGFLQLDELVKRGLFPLRDESCLTNGYLETPIDWIEGLVKGAKLKHLPTFIRTMNPNDIGLNFTAEAVRNAQIAKGMIIINTFDDLEEKVLEAIKTIKQNVYAIGPLSLLCQHANDRKLLPLKSSLWKEDTDCLLWLDTQNPNLVIYVNYGSLTVLTPEQLEEFAWGLANSKHPFLWVIRSDLVEGKSNVITDRYMKEIEGRGLLTGWCPQEKVLQHPSVAMFLTHCGWNSTLESISEGVPMICWPFFADQPMNCLYACQEWSVGMEMEEGDVKREKVESLVREMMEGERGKEVKRKAMEWKRRAAEATNHRGSSHNNFEKLMKYLKCEEK